MIRDPEVQCVLRPFNGDLLLDMIVLPGILVLDIRMVIDMGMARHFLPIARRQGVSTPRYGE